MEDLHTDGLGHVPLDLHPLVRGHVRLLLLLRRRMVSVRMLLMVSVGVLVRVLRMSRLLQHVISRGLRILLLVVASGVAGVIVLPDLGMIVESLFGGW